MTLRTTLLAIISITGGLLLSAHYSDAIERGGSSVLLLGDSIGAGYGLPAEQSWAYGLEQHLQTCGISFINASVSGETSAGGLRRLPQLMQKYRPKLLMIELGGNDGLRGYPLEKLKNNLEQMVQIAHQHQADVYLLGMQIPPNYGPVYTRRFAATFREVAEHYKTALHPFFLDGVGGQADLMQADGIHPNAAAQATLLANALSELPLNCSSKAATVSGVGGQTGSP